MQIDGYKLLANAIVYKAYEDYVKGRMDEISFIHFVESDYYTLLTDIEKEVLIKKAKEDKEYYDNGGILKRAGRYTDREMDL